MSVYPKTLSRSLLAALLAACCLTAAAPAATGEQTVAEIGGQVVTRAELETFAAGQLRQIDQQRHQLLEASLEQLIDSRLLEAEAARREVDLATLLDTEVESKVAAVSDQEVDEWYAANQARVRQPKAEVAEQIRGYLRHQRTAAVRQALLDALRAGAGVTIHLEPLRVPLEVADAPSRGPRTAPVELVVFSDFQCPACAGVKPALEAVHQAYPEQVLVAFKHFPLDRHPQARPAAEAAMCAADQDRFWAMHDALFTHQDALQPAQLKARARELGLDGAAFDACFDAGTHRAAVAADYQAGLRAGVGGTPAIYVNGRPVALLRGTPPFDQLAKVIDDELRRAGR